MTVEVVSHSPSAVWRLRPTKRADSARSVVEPFAPTNSDENLAGSPMSVTSSHTRSIGACTNVSTSTVGPSAYFIAPSCRIAGRNGRALPRLRPRRPCCDHRCCEPIRKRRLNLLEAFSHAISSVSSTIASSSKNVRTRANSASSTSRSRQRDRVGVLERQPARVRRTIRAGPSNCTTHVSLSVVDTQVAANCSVEVLSELASVQCGHTTVQQCMQLRVTTSPQPTALTTSRAPHGRSRARVHTRGG